MLHRGGHCIRWVLIRSGALHTHMHFDQGVLGRLGCMPVQLVKLARMTEIGIDVGACSMCVSASQSTWGATLVATY
jgi:hypothetical protein